jgi:hypothetical protein
MNFTDDPESVIRHVDLSRILQDHFVPVGKSTEEWFVRVKWIVGLWLVSVGVATPVCLAGLASAAIRLIEVALSS